MYNDKDIQLSLKGSATTVVEVVHTAPGRHVARGGKAISFSVLIAVIRLDYKKNKTAVQITLTTNDQYYSANTQFQHTCSNTTKINEC